MADDEDVHLVLDVVEGIVRHRRVVDLAVAAVILLGNWLPEALVDILEQRARVARPLEEDVDEEQLVENAAGEGEPPEGWMRPQKGAVGHYRHPEGDPEEEGRREAPLPVVDRVVGGRLYEGGVDQARNEDNEHGDRVRPPEVGRGLCVVQLFLPVLLK